MAIVRVRAAERDGKVEIMRCHGLDLGRHRASRLTPDLIECADPILTMTGEHTDRIVGHFPEAAPKTVTFTGYAGGPGDVEDPLYRGTEEAYERCAEQLGAQVSRILEKLRVVNGRVGT